MREIEFIFMNFFPKRNAISVEIFKFTLIELAIEFHFFFYFFFFENILFGAKH